jgi:hypothetical protein
MLKIGIVVPISGLYVLQRTCPSSDLRAPKDLEKEGKGFLVLVVRISGLDDSQKDWVVSRDGSFVFVEQPDSPAPCPRVDPSTTKFGTEADHELDQSALHSGVPRLVGQVTASSDDSRRILGHHMGSDPEKVPALMLIAYRTLRDQRRNVDVERVVCGYGDPEVYVEFR